MTDFVPVDTPLADPASTGPAVPQAADAGGGAPIPPGAPPADPFDAADPSTFGEHSRYIEKLRNENAATRLKLREAEERAGRYSRFDGIEPGDLSVFADLAERYKTGDLAGAATFARQIADQLAPSDLSPSQRGQVAEAAGAATTDQPLTVDQFNRLMAEREQAREQQQSVVDAQRDLDRQATDLGYPPDSIYYLPLMKTAADDLARTGTLDLQAAAAKIQASRDADLAAYVEAKRQQASSMPAPSPTGGGAPTAPAGEPKTLAEAHARARARNREAFGGTGVL